MTNKSPRGIKRFISAMMVAVMAACSPVACAPAMAEDTAAAEPSYSSQMRGLTAFQIVNDMGAGWNLGNTLESANNETYWGNPVTTREMIDDIAQRGFKTLRVPVRWDDHYTNASTYTIDSAYMDRVEEVVDYGLDNDMYVILNVHHNDLQHNVPNTDVISAELTAIWGQIGERFKNYGDKLIFEVNNEPRSEEDWTGNSAYYESVNLCNEAARAAIRATGGNNADRLVMLPTYCASGDYAKASAWTKNADDDMIAVSIHAYLPFDFAFEGTGHTDWRDSDLTELAAFFDRMELLFLSKGVPIVIGEFGACNKNNTTDREKYAAVYGGLARKFAQQDIPCVWWDNNCYGTGAENFGIYNRSQRSFTYGGIADALIGAYDGNPVCEEYTTGEELLSAGGSCDTWGQAVQLDAGTIVTLSAEDTIYCNYTSNAAPEFILQSDSNGAKGWVKIDPDSCADGVAQWKYSTLLSKFGGDFSDLSRGYIGATTSSLTVTKVYIPRTSAHTHSYTGTENITIPATATTKGRKTIGCSVSGCTACKIEVFEKQQDFKPTNVKATAGDKQVTVSWDKVSGATNYIVYSYVDGKYTSQGTTTSTTKTVTGLTNGTKYGFLVKAYAGGKWSSYTSADLVYATPTGSTKPQNVKATAGDKQVTVTWNAVTGATNYIVYSYVGGKYTSQGTTTSTTKTVTGLTNGTKYGFLVKALVGGAWSSYTSADLVYATPIAPGSTKPQNVKATAGDKQVTVTWDKVSGATNYIVYSYVDGKYTSQGTTTSTTKTVTGLTNGTKYGFLVKAYANGAWSSYTSADLVYATPTGSTKPQNVKATAGDKQVMVTWNAVTGATNYIVYSYVGGKYTSQGTTTSTTKTVTGLTNGTKYGFLVKAYVGGAWSSYTSADLVYATPVAPGSGKPTNVKATAGDKQVTVSWDKVSGATNYIVYSYVDGKYTSQGTTTSTTKTVTGLTNGTKYGFLVKAYVGGAWSSYTSADLVYATPTA